MKSFIRIPIIIVMLFLWSSGALGQDTLQFADLGNYPLEAVYDTKYHLVWTPKYRKWILREDIREHVKQIFKESS
jgi:Transposase IS200 like